MMFVIGIVLFALAILVSVALHECGHMWVARATGMKVRRYFVGFGPTLWSTIRPNKLGTTEYGVKAIPLGGFCDIAGMTSVDTLRHFLPDWGSNGAAKPSTCPRRSLPVLQTGGSTKCLAHMRPCKPKPAVRCACVSSSHMQAIGCNKSAPMRSTPCC